MLSFFYPFNAAIFKRDVVPGARCSSGSQCYQDTSECLGMYASTSRHLVLRNGQDGKHPDRFLHRRKWFPHIPQYLTPTTIIRQRIKLAGAQDSGEDHRHRKPLGMWRRGRGKDIKPCHNAGPSGSGAGVSVGPPSSL